MTSAQGADYSAYQAPLTLGDLEGFDFAFTKVTNGLGEVDPNFTHNWALLGDWGKPRGGYHEFIPGLSATAQADFMLANVNGAGLRPGDMLAVVASDYGQPSNEEIGEFGARVRQLAPHSPALVYTDLSVGAALTGCTGYPLWIAWPEDTPPDSVAPWRTWMFWQWSETGLDRDAFNGSPEDLAAWIASYAPAPSPSVPSFIQSGDPDMFFVQPGVQTPFVVPQGATQMRFTTVSGPTPDWAVQKVSVYFHGAEKDQEIQVSPATVWPVVDITNGATGGTLNITQGSRLVAVGFLTPETSEAA
jgi:lysozyme